VESPHTKAEHNRKKEIENNNFKLSKFKDVPSKVKALVENKSKIGAEAK